MLIAPIVRSFVRFAPLLCLAVITLGASLLTACSPTEAATTTASSTARQVAVVVDFSGSRSPAELKRSKEMIGGLTRRLEPGDQMVVLPVVGVEDGRKLSPPRLRTIPAAKAGKRPDPRAADKVREEIRTDVNALFDRQPKMTRAETDLLATMFQVRDYALEAGPRRVDIILLSDMVQDARGKRFTAASGVPTKNWIAQQHDKELVPQLPGACVTVVGADSSTVAGVARRVFWQAYFAAAGADLTTDRYRLTLTQLDGALCG